jgi:hypothetical protein
MRTSKTRSLKREAAAGATKVERAAVDANHLDLVKPFDRFITAENKALIEQEPKVKV